MENYYDILGIPQNAKHSLIKTRYRKLALKYHPDRNSNTKIEEKFKQITEAYNTLKNPSSRKKYDELLSRSTRIFNQNRNAREKKSDKNNRYDQYQKGKGEDFVFYEPFKTKNHLIFINLNNVFFIPLFSLTFYIVYISDYYKSFSLFPTLLNGFFSIVFFVGVLGGLLVLKISLKFIRRYLSPIYAKAVCLITGLFILNKATLIYSELLLTRVPENLINLATTFCFSTLMIGVMVDYLKNRFEIGSVIFTIIFSSFSTFLLSCLIASPVFIFAQAFALPSKLYYQFDLWSALLKISVLGPMIGNLAAIIAHVVVKKNGNSNLS